jgi:ABC-type polysaccharide/polyol phosphate export permease
MLFTLGLAWIVAALNVFVRDISQVVSVILTFWFWFTPIFYSPSLLEEQHQGLASLMRLNPMSHVVLGYKDCLLRMQMPDLAMLAGVTLGSLVLFVAGGMFFRRLKREFVDVL